MNIKVDINCVYWPGRVPSPQYSPNDPINYASNGQLHTEQTVPPPRHQHEPDTELSSVFYSNQAFFVAYLTSVVNIIMEMDLEKILKKGKPCFVSMFLLLWKSEISKINILGVKRVK